MRQCSCRNSTSGRPLEGPSDEICLGLTDHRCGSNPVRFRARKYFPVCVSMQALRVPACRANRVIVRNGAHHIRPRPPAHNIQFCEPLQSDRAFKSRAQKYSYFVFAEIVLQSCRSAPMERGASRSSRTWCGMRWTPMCLLTSGTGADGKGVWSWRPKGLAPSCRQCVSASRR
jgi:hypothetical protein